ncbi:MAG: hypothetical protein K8R68_01895 [Bacteroidales bacterium]|nr:hypothetical protein [Bacteroidales bacterium]
MRKLISFFTVLILVVPVLFTGCQKENLTTEPAAKDSDILKSDGFASNSEIEYCGTPVTYSLVGDNWTPVGDIIAGNDETTFYVTLTAYHQNWSIVESRLFVGDETLISGLIDPSTSYPDPSLLPNLVTHDPAVQTYTYEIPLDQLDECFSVIAYVKAYDGAVYIDAFGGNLAFGATEPRPYYFNFCVEPCAPVTECETAYAYGDNFATCFLDIPDINSNNWGWSNGPISDPSSYSWDIYAGAGQCDITKGTWVGTLDVDYSGGIATVTYNIDPNFTLDETHLYVGSEILARNKKGQFTTAPGQFPYSGETSYTIDGLTGDIYVVAHSVVCGEFE